METYVTLLIHWLNYEKNSDSLPTLFELLYIFSLVFSIFLLHMMYGKKRG